MSIYLQDNSVVLDSGSVATSSDCCCGGVCCDCDGNCDDTVTQEDCESNGGQWFATDTCDDNPCDTLTTGACCDGADCSIQTQACCEFNDGTYQGDDTVCDPNPCGNTGACCVDGVCSITTEDECTGVYQGDGTTCDDVDCTKGACCIGGICSQTTEADCTGTFQGLGVPCIPNPCLACDGCAFLNPDDGRYYRTRALHVSADYSQGFLHGHYDSVKTETCSGGGITCASAGNGTFSYQPDGSCECTETFVCGGPAFGFFGLSGMTYMETCNDPSCGSAFILSCDFGGCSNSESFVYSDPCIPV